MPRACTHSTMSAMVRDKAMSVPLSDGLCPRPFA
jgi:hypothetical protein